LTEPNYRFSLLLSFPVKTKNLSWSTLTNDRHQPDILDRAKLPLFFASFFSREKKEVLILEHSNANDIYQSCTPDRAKLPLFFASFFSREKKEAAGKSQTCLARMAGTIAHALTRSQG
jgi:adenylate cyclase